MRKRNLVSMVIFTIITCGIMQWVYFYQVMSDINYASNENDTAGIDLLLTIITCGLWGIFCYWKYSKKLVKLGGEDNTIINVILAVLSFQIIALIILQSSMNNLLERQSSYS